MRQKLDTAALIVYNDNKQPSFFPCFIVTTSLPSYTYATGCSEDQNIRDTFRGCLHMVYAQVKLSNNISLNGSELQVWKQIHGIKTLPNCFDFQWNY